MQGKRTLDMFAHIQGRFPWQISPPLQTRRAFRLWPLAALRILENLPGFLRTRALPATKGVAQNGVN
jgi:hypothetical protein